LEPAKEKQIENANISNGTEIPAILLPRVGLLKLKGVKILSEWMVYDLSYPRN
jgi:hypothetical protein